MKTRKLENFKSKRGQQLPQSLWLYEEHESACRKNQTSVLSSLGMALGRSPPSNTQNCVASWGQNEWGGSSSSSYTSILGGI